MEQEHRRSLSQHGDGPVFIPFRKVSPLQGKGKHPLPGGQAIEDPVRTADRDC